MRDGKGFKAYILKKVVLRIDIKASEGIVMGSDIDDIIRSIRSEFENFEFTRNFESYAANKSNEFQTELFSDNTDCVGETNFRYKLVKDELTILLSTDFIIFEIKSENKYKGFRNYYSYAYKIISQYTKIEGVSIEVKRIGLRKVNYVFVNSLQVIEHLFNNVLFGFYSDKNFLFPNSLSGFSAIKKLSVVNSNSICNIISAAQPGLIYTENNNPKEKIRVLLDIDSILSVANKHSCRFTAEDIDQAITELNRNIIHVYIQSLSDEFYNALKLNDNSFFRKWNIIGVSEK